MKKIILIALSLIGSVSAKADIIKYGEDHFAVDPATGKISRIDLNVQSAIEVKP